MHEKQLHEATSFITLTYAEENLPSGGTLKKKDFQDFLKRLRKHAAKKLSYYYCGEYGERTRRPHFHSLLFGYDFPDQTPISRSGDITLYRSDVLQSLWPQGHCSVGALTFESAAYVARYIMKKINGKDAADHYRVVNPDTGEITNLLPEYTNMSLKPAIGKNWYRRYHDDVYPSDEVVLRGKQMKPPKYYDRQLELADPTLYLKMKADRKAAALRRSHDSTPARLAVREAVKRAQIKNLHRGLE